MSPGPVECTDCGRPIGPDSPYYARRVGPKCGGRIRKGRQPATPTHCPTRAADDVDGQLALFNPPPTPHGKAPVVNPSTSEPATITAPRPVTLDQDTARLTLRVADREIAAAWAAAWPDTGRWWVRRRGGNTYRVEDRDSALLVLEDDQRTAEWWEQSRLLTHHPRPGGEGWFLAVAPAGVVCVGCGEDLGGRTLVATVQEVENPAERHVICDHCDAYNEPDDDADD